MKVNEKGPRFEGPYLFNKKSYFLPTKAFNALAKRET